MARKAATTTDKPAKARKGSKTTLSEANLVDLGPERLAAILLDLSSDSHVKRVLRLELFAESNTEGLALEISKRLATVGKSSSRINWRKRAAFAKDLDLHRGMIERLAQDDATAALDLPMADPMLWSVERPTLYTLDVRLLRDGQVADERRVPIGFRTIRFDAAQGFFLNDRPVKLKGVCLHQDHRFIACQKTNFIIRRR